MTPPAAILHRRVHNFINNSITKPKISVPVLTSFALVVIGGWIIVHVVYT